MTSLRPASARFGGLRADDLLEVADFSEDIGALDRGGWWAVSATFEGAITGYRFGRVGPAAPLCPALVDAWLGPQRDDWTSSLSAEAYIEGVRVIRERIAGGDVYQVNLCRMLSARMPDPAIGPYPLAAVLELGNPAPFGGVLDTGTNWVVSASPELFLRRDGDRVFSSPIKGTAATAEAFAAKDVPENIMITDLVRNDLGRVAVPGSVVVTELLAPQAHPGLVHLVSTVVADLRPDIDWSDLLTATFPPGSVSGAPKLSALQVISELEPVSRGVYCGAIGYVDADRRQAKLAVGIRTFAAANGVLTFGTGAGITWESDPQAEWQETELKAARLVALASAGGPITPSSIRSARSVGLSGDH